MTTHLQFFRCQAGSRIPDRLIRSVITPYLSYFHLAYLSQKNMMITTTLIFVVAPKGADGIVWRQVFFICKRFPFQCPYQQYSHGTSFPIDIGSFFFAEANHAHYFTV
jgi:hypothetical protein